MKLALVLYAAGVIAQRPKIVKKPKQLAPIGVMVGAACLLIASQPDLGTALVIAFTTAAILVAAGMPVRYLGRRLRRRVRARVAVRDQRAVPPRRA